MDGGRACAANRGRWRLAIVACLALAVALGLPAGAGFAQDGGDQSDGSANLVLGRDGCWHDAKTGEVTSCEEVEDAPQFDGGLIPGTDGCLYYPGGGLAECPAGTDPIDGGCIPPADGSTGCVIPGPVGSVSEGPDPSLPPDEGLAPEAVLGETLEPAPVADPPAPADQQPVVEPLLPEPEVVEPVEPAPAFDPLLVAQRVRLALTPIASWLAAVLGWLVGLL